jgi:hypothetical protein
VLPRGNLRDLPVGRGALFPHGGEKGATPACSPPPLVRARSTNLIR